MDTLNVSYQARPVTVAGTYTPRVGDIPPVVLVESVDGHVFPVSINDVEVAA